MKTNVCQKEREVRPDPREMLILEILTFSLCCYVDW